MEEAYDKGDNPQGKLKAWIKKNIKGGPGYTAEKIPLVKQLSGEVTKVFNGGAWKDGKGKRTVSEGYPEWIEKQPWEVIDVEKRMAVDVGPVIIAPQSDQNIKTYGPKGQERYWVVDRKTTQRDDPYWKTRWILDMQTTLEMIAAEGYYGEEFMGVMVSQISYSRQQSKLHKGSLPQPIGKVIRHEPRWVSKNSPRLRVLVDNRLESLAREVEFHYENDLWPSNGMETRHCDFCEFRKFCRGEMPVENLKPRPLDDVGKLNKARLKKFEAARRNFLEQL
jgi:hypothetical protein